MSTISRIVKVDNVDIFSQFGVFVKEGSYKDLLKVPAYKTITTTDYEENDYSEVDLMDVKLNKVDVSIDFYILDIENFNDFLEFMYLHQVANIEFLDLQLSFLLRLTANSSISYLKKIGSFTLTFSNDNYNNMLPVFPVPSNNLIPATAFSLDGVNFSRYGIFILKGTEASILKAPSLKENVIFDDLNAKGVRYSTANGVKFKSKDITLNLLINCESVAECFRRHFTFFKQLTKVGSRVFSETIFGNTFGVYYKSSSVSRFKILRSGRVWYEFSVVLSLI